MVKLVDSHPMKLNSIPTVTHMDHWWYQDTSPKLPHPWSPTLHVCTSIVQALINDSVNQVRLHQGCTMYGPWFAICSQPAWLRPCLTHLSHCLNHIFTPVNRSSTLNLRERGHPFELTRYTYNLTRKSFIMRALYEFIWVPLDRTVPLLFSPVGSNYMSACK